jgi:inner membrane transporter RhtA
MNATSRRPVLPPLPAVVVSILRVQGGAALAKGLFPALGATGTVAMRLVLSAVMLLALFRPPLGRLVRAQWRAIIP